MLLAIDSSSDDVGIALLEGASVRGELICRVGRDNTARLVPAIGELLGLAGAGMADVAALAVATGPGSFNGLRAGLAVAKGLAVARGLPLVGVSTFEVTAAPFLTAGRPTCALVVAGRGRWHAALYLGATATEPTIWSALPIAELLGRLEPGTLLVGEIEAAGIDPDTLARRGMHVPEPPVAARRRPSVLGELGRRRLAAGHDDGATLQPIYLGHSPVRSRVERPAAVGAAADGPGGEACT